MPELPEVETIRRDLEKTVLGKKIVQVSVHHPKVIREPSVAAFQKGIEGAVVKHILRRAKLLILELSNGKALAVHLKMTGQLVYPGGSPKSRVSFRLSDGKTLDFNDQRLFAELRLVDEWRDLKFVRGLGPEPQELTLPRFKEMLRARKTRIKPLLMDQGFISGIGNLYAAEILFRAGIHPERRADSLAEKEKGLLFKAINDILKAAILHAGSSVDDYVRVSGAKGGYVKYLKAYGRKGEPCLVCKKPIQRISQGGRGTYFCPGCQK